MNLNVYYQLSDDWGWFIDIDEYNNCKKNVLLHPYKRSKHIDKLQTIEEDEYEYYQQNYKDLEENYDINFKSPNKNARNKNARNKNAPNKNPPNKNEDNTIFNVCSTTLITVLLTYVIFVVL
jgi:hypothetical protein